MRIPPLVVFVLVSMVLFYLLLGAVYMVIRLKPIRKWLIEFVPQSEVEEMIRNEYRKRIRVRQSRRRFTIAVKKALKHIIDF